MNKPLTLAGERDNRIVATRQAAVAYAEFTHSTAKYPSVVPAAVNAKFLYVVIGLANEVGELAELFDQEAVNDGDRMERYAKAWKELGDVQWYAARITVELPELKSFAEMVYDAIYELKNGPKRELRLSGFDLQSALCAYSGRVLGVVKKMMRDGDTWSEEKRAEKMAELQEFLTKVVAVSVEFAEKTGPLVGCPGGYVHLLRCNSDKLADRKDRGVLHGDGDTR